MARTTSNDHEPENGEAGGGGGHTGSTAVRAAAAAAVAGAAGYGVRKALEHRDHRDQPAEKETEPGDEGSLSAKKDDLAETLSTKASDVKRAAGKLVPRRKRSDLSSLASSAWEAAAEQLLPFAGRAAAAAGKAAAEKAPDAVRREIIPRFIDGFQRSS